MEGVLSIGVGLLVSICVAGLLGVFPDGGNRWDDLGAARATRSRALDFLISSARRTSGELDALLRSHGVVTPRRRRELAEIERSMPEAFNSLAVSLGSGLSLVQAMQHVGGRVREPVRTEFLHTSALMACGASATDALDELVARLRAPGLELVVLALKVSRRTGAPLGGLLSDASRVVGERMELRRELEVKTAQVRMSARLVSMMPMVMTGFLSVFSNDFRRGMFTVPGMVSLVAALFLNILAGLIFHKVMQVDM